MLVVVALLGGFFIIAGDQANIAGRAWLTLLLVAAFAGAVVLDAAVGDGPNRWYIPASTFINIVLVAVGLLKIWGGALQPSNTADPAVWSDQFWRWLAVVALLRLALLVMQTYGLHFVVRTTKPATRWSALTTLAFVWLTALVLAVPATFPELDWPTWWWRTAGATALVAVVLAVIPAVVRAFEPREQKQMPPAGSGYYPRTYPGVSPYPAPQPYGTHPYGAQPYGPQPYGPAPVPVQQPYAAPFPLAPAQPAAPRPLANATQPPAAPPQAVTPQAVTPPQSTPQQPPAPQLPTPTPPSDASQPPLAPPQ